jgi:four helix bundle protein
MVNPRSQYRYQFPNKSKKPDPKKRMYSDLRERFFLFGVRIIDIAEMLPNTIICNELQKQLVRSGTSIAANFEEADGTLTKRDFINKTVIARKEAKETKYWLRLISERYIKKEMINKDINESQELINILSAIINNSRKN